MISWLPAVAWCIGGGLLRAVIGLRKAFAEKRKVRWGLFALTILEAAIIGVVLGYLLKDFSPILAFFAGVGGTDLIDNAYRLIKFASVKIPVK